MAVFYVTPLTNITDLINSDEVMPGDVLLLENGVYRQTVVVEKNFIRIVANGRCVVFDGENTLIIGILLLNVVGVEVLGLRLQNYSSTGILSSSGSSNRIINNNIKNGNVGIWTVASSSNLIYRNIVEDVLADGIRLSNASTGNFVLENKVSGSGDDGIDCFFAEDTNNLFVGNSVLKNASNGFEVLGENCCIFVNRSIGNAARGFIFLRGTNALQNEARDNTQSGISAWSDNTFVGMNQIERNQMEGIEVISNFSIIQQNDIRFNRNYGLAFYEDASYNLALRNRLVGNEPASIVDNGTGNNFVENVTEKSPCECKPESFKRSSEKAAAGMDYIAQKRQKEIEAQKELIAKAEALMSAVPEIQKQTQELILGMMKEQLTKLTEYQKDLASAAASPAAPETAQQATPAVLTDQDK